MVGEFLNPQKILDLIDDLFEKREMIDALSKENNELKEQLKTKGEFTYKNNTYWNKEDGPYCSACFDDKKRAIRMTTNPGNYIAECPVCKTRVNYTGHDSKVSYSKAMNDFASSY